MSINDKIFLLKRQGVKEHAWSAEEYQELLCFLESNGFSLVDGVFWGIKHTVK